MVLTLVLENLKLNISFFSFSFWFFFFFFSFFNYFFVRYMGLRTWKFCAGFPKCQGIYLFNFRRRGPKGSCVRLQTPYSPNTITPPPKFGYRLPRTPQKIKKMTPRGGYLVTKSPHRSHPWYRNALFLKNVENHNIIKRKFVGINPKSGIRFWRGAHIEAEDPTLSKSSH